MFLFNLMLGEVARMLDREGNGGGAADTEISPDAATSTEDTQGNEDGSGSSDGGEITDETLEAFNSLGLGRQYATPAAALKALVDGRQQIGTLTHRLSQLESQLSQAGTTVQKTDMKSIREQFEADPAGTFEKMVSKIQDFEGQLKLTNQDRGVLAEQRAFDSLVSACAEIPDLKDVASTLRLVHKIEPGTNKLWDAMIREFNTNPTFKHLRGTADEHLAIPTLYQLVKGTKPPVGKISPDKKIAGQTSGGGTRDSAAPKVSVQNMSVAEIEAYRAKHGKLPPA